MLEILKSIKDLLKRSLERVSRIFKQSWKAFSSIFKTSTSNKQQSKEDLEAEIDTPDDFSKEKVSDPTSSPTPNPDHSVVVESENEVSISNNFSKRKPPLQALDCSTTIKATIKTSTPDEHPREKPKLALHVLDRSMIIESEARRSAPDNFSEEKNLLDNLESSTQMINPRSLGKIASLLEEATEEEEEQVKSDLLYAKPAELKLEVHQPKDAIDRQVRRYAAEEQMAKVGGEELCSEFFRRNNNKPSNFDDEQLKNLSKLLLLFSDCFKFLHNKSELKEKACFLETEIEGAMVQYMWSTGDKGEIISEFSSRIDEFTKLHPEANQIMDEVEAVRKERSKDQPHEAQSRKLSLEFFKSYRALSFHCSDERSENLKNLFNIFNKFLILQHLSLDDEDKFISYFEPLARSLWEEMSKSINEKLVAAEFLSRINEFAKLNPEVTQTVDKIKEALLKLGIIDEYALKLEPQSSRFIDQSKPNPASFSEPSSELVPQVRNRRE